ncbi:MAG: ribosome-associated translation inhibitor RaiA [candidate division WOR-3 bacterium]|nr:ribosome-associated translation inhibitor RaiA [candidate division WOR-3 bacterium]
MQINITARHFELTEEIKDYTHKKLDKLNHFENLLTNIDIVLAKDSKQMFAEGKVNLKGNYVLAKASANDIYLAIGLLADKLIKQVKHHYEKLKSKKKFSRSKSVV